MTSPQTATLDASGAVPLRRDATIMGVVGYVHLVSHFYQLLLAPLFPWLRDEFGLSYTELGFIMTVLFVVSAVGQAVSGFVVDHWGAMKTLVGGLLSLSTGAVLLCLADGYQGVLLAAIAVGIGNAVFHPVDFWLINHRVSEPRLGPAYSVHGLAGSLGWAAAPVFLVGLTLQFDWRVAVAAAALLPLTAILITWCYRGVFVTGSDADAAAEVEGTTAAKAAPLAFLRDPAIWMCCLFFALVATALGGVQSFAPTIFASGYALTLGAAAMSVTIYMLASGGGMMVGGWLVQRSQRLERNIAIALVLASLASALIATSWLPAAAALALMAVMGFGSGLSGPSRDMLIRRAAPPGATGRVYGVVYSGLDIGIALAPLAFGRMLDSGVVTGVFYAVGGFLFLAVLVAHGVARRAVASS